MSAIARNRLVLLWWLCNYLLWIDIQICDVILSLKCCWRSFGHPYLQEKILLGQSWWSEGVVYIPPESRSSSGSSWAWLWHSGTQPWLHPWQRVHDWNKTSWLWIFLKLLTKIYNTGGSHWLQRHLQPGSLNFTVLHWRWLVEAWR